MAATTAQAAKPFAAKPLKAKPFKAELLKICFAGPIRVSPFGVFLSLSTISVSA
jgi:hypothetical protein